MDLKRLTWDIGILVAMAGVCAVVVGLAFGASDYGGRIAAVIFNLGVFALVLSLGVAVSLAKINLRGLALFVGLLGASGGIFAGFWALPLLLLSLVALIGSALATRSPRASIPLMLVPAVMGWLAVPSLYSIPARVLMAASLMLAVHLIWAYFAQDKPDLGTRRELDVYDPYD